jgi:hypothetical protein
MPAARRIGDAFKLGKCKRFRCWLWHRWQRLNGWVPPEVNRRWIERWGSIPTSAINDPEEVWQWEQRQ